jgi:hypothetical protein
MKGLNKFFIGAALVMAGLVGVALAGGTPSVSNNLCVDAPHEETIEDILEEREYAEHTGRAAVSIDGYNFGPDAKKDIGEAIDGHTFLMRTINGNVEYLLVDN